MNFIHKPRGAPIKPPGNVLELDETIHAGLIREIAEETGLTVEPVALTGVYNNMPRGIIALVFRCVITDSTPAPPMRSTRSDGSRPTGCPRWTRRTGPGCSTRSTATLNRFAHAMEHTSSVRSSA